MRFSTFLSASRPRGFELMIVLCLLPFSICSAPAQSLKVLHMFNGSDGQFPYYAPLIFDKAGNLYGTTYYGGTVNSECAYGCGAVFELSPNNGGWSETVLYSFATNSGDGTFPAAGLIFDAAGNLYGTTSRGGTSNEGTVFELVRQKDRIFAEKILYNFCSVGMYCSDGDQPTAGLVFDAAGNLFGTTSSYDSSPYGVVFELTKGANGQWSETVVHAFNGTDGTSPAAGLIIDGKGNLYGTAGGPLGGPYCDPDTTAFELSPERNKGWTFVVLYNFGVGGPDGYCSTGPLVRDAAGHLYGTTYVGGTYDAGAVFELVRGKNAEWTEKTLHNFNGNDGAQPYGGLVRDGQGNLFGTLEAGGKNGFGSVFKLSPQQGSHWKETILHNFTGLDGSSPFAGLISDGAGNLYGTTYFGGKLNDCEYDGCGVVFELTP